MKVPRKDPKACDQAKARLVALESERAPYEQNWRRIDEYCLPRRDYSVRYGQPSLRRRRLVDTSAIVAAERCAALIFGYMLPPYDSWVRPGLLGRDPVRREAQWFDNVGVQMHKALARPRSGFVGTAYENLIDGVTKGNFVAWGGRTGEGSQPVWMALPLAECFWSENADNRVDTVFRHFRVRLRKAARMFPSEGMEDRLRREPSGESFVEYLYVCEPNPGGTYGGFATNKPFRADVYCLTTQEIVRQEGFDTFPFAIGRLNKLAGSPYGEGFGANALPMAMLLNEIQETVVRAAELQADPPMVNFLGSLGRVDRRPGGVTNVTAAELRRLGDNPRALLGRLYEGNSDVAVSIELVRDLRQNIEFVFFIDWMRLALNSQMTATEVNDRRDIRLRSMAPVVSRMESEMLSSVAERQFFMMQDMLPKPPESLDGEEMTFDFYSPLAQAQQRSALETSQRVLQLVGGVAELSPGILDTVDVDGVARDGMVAAGIREKHLRSKAEIAERREAAAEREAQQQEMEQAQAMANAARDAGQAAASMEGGR